MRCRHRCLLDPYADHFALRAEEKKKKLVKQKKNELNNIKRRGGDGMLVAV